MVRDYIIAVSILLFAGWSILHDIFTKPKYLLLGKDTDIINSLLIEAIRKNEARATALEEKIN